MTKYEKELELLEMSIRKAIGKLADDADGKVFLQWLMEECGFFQPFFPRDDKVTVWNCSRRDLALKLYKYASDIGKADVLMKQERKDKI